ncbi:FAD-dependent oxidoreductase [Mycolicibacterium poriferae]|uniref:FAD-dependent oxidoreductase n=1 Tax=Mycolicibacterium poriferae TaxID=39694 RepID=UPI00321BBDB4
MVMPIGAMATAGLQVFALVRRLREELGVNTTCGASNISFGLPNRHGINNAFLPMAIASGMTSAIMNPCALPTPMAKIAEKRAELEAAGIIVPDEMDDETFCRLMGIGSRSAQPLRSFADAVVLKMAARHAGTAVVIGAGLIGCEAAGCLAALGVATTVVAPEPVPLLRRFGVDVGERVVKMLFDAGVRFVGSADVTAVVESGVVLAGGENVDGDVVVAATGVRPDVRLAAEAGLSIRAGRIVVDEQMRTSARNIYAAGDVTLAYNVAAGRQVVSEHWRDAALQGRVAGLTAAGVSAQWDTASGFSCTIGTSRLAYRGWGGPYERCRVVDQRDGFVATYHDGGDIVGRLVATTSPVS